MRRLFHDQTGDNDEAGLSDSGDIEGNYVDDVSVTNGVITITYSSADPQSANSNIDDAELELSPVTFAGSVDWNCQNGSGLEDKWLPAACR